MPDGALGKGFAVLDEASALAQDMLALAHDSLLVSYRFMNRPIAQLPVRTRMDIRTCATDARALYFSPGFVLDTFRDSKPLVARSYLHMVLHCLLGHPFVPQGADMLRWSCAADAAVAALLQQLDAPTIRIDDPERDRELARINEAVDTPTAERIYAYLEHTGADAGELMRLYLLFGADMHDMWLSSDNETPQRGEVEDDECAQAQQQLQEQWRKIARQTSIDAQRDESGRDSEALTVALSGLDAQPMGLDELLRQFAAPSEAIQVNPDEFDYIYYTYGLAHYGNIPLIEPLEYVESPHVRDFAIAIDTSGSVDEKMARLFISYACGMLMAPNALGTESRVRIFQCDMRIHDERIVRTPEDVSAYLDTLVLKGRGGTDFRPVFDHIDDLIESGQVDEVAGLVYFTDGKGDFPEHAPAYDTAFVFVDKPAPAPSWATSVLVYADELENV